MAQEEVFSTMPVRKAVISQCVPAVIGQLAVLLYSLADSYFVAKLEDPVSLAAITIGTPVFLLLTAIGNLPGVGGATMISAALGRGERCKAADLASITFWFGITISAAFTLWFSFYGDNLLYLAGAKEQTIQAAHLYATWTVAAGAIPVIMGLVLSNMLRSVGMAKQASLGITIGALVNIVLDIFLVLPQFADMGIAGAGIATFASNLISAAYLGFLIIRSQHETVLSFSCTRVTNSLKSNIKQICAIGTPSAIQYLLTVVAVAAQAFFVSRYSAEAIAALGVVKRLDYLPLYFSIGVSQGILPLLAFNHAAGNHERRQSIFNHGMMISVSFSVICFIVYESFAPQIARFFISEPITSGYIASFLRCMVVAMPFMAFCYPMIVQFQAMKQIKAAMACSILRKGVVDIPLLFLFDAIIPLYGCMWVQPVVDFSAMILAQFLYKTRRANG